MTFLNPLLLLALAAAVIPIVVHLFHFRRPRRIDFSSLRFVRALEQSATRRLKLRQWLLLAMRLLAVIFLVLAFARPRAETAWASVLGERPRASMALVVDNSLSMTRRDAGGSFLDQARAMASTVAENMQPGDELFILQTSGGMTPEPFTRSGAALDAIAEIDPAPQRGSLRDAIARAATALEGAVHVHREIFVFSDLQSGSVVDSALTTLQQGMAVSLVPVGSGTVTNVGVREVEVESRVIETGRPVQVAATLRSNVAAPGTSGAVFIEGERVAQAAIDLTPTSESRLTFNFSPRGEGWLAGSVRLDDDGFEWDNQRFFTLHVPGSRRVLLVEGPASGARSIELALTLGQLDGSFVVNRIPEAAFGGADHSAYNVIVLAGPSGLSSGEVAAIDRFVAQGGGLVLFPGADNQEGVNAVLRAVGGGQVGAVTEGSDRFGVVDFDHALFDGVLERRAGDELESPAITRGVRYSPGGGAEASAIRLASGRIFLQEIRHGSGAAMLFTVSAASGWGDLAQRGVFVPLMHRAVQVAAAAPPADESLQAGAPATLRVAGLDASVRFTIEGADGEELIPEVRVVPGGLLLDFIAPETPGVYTLRQGDRVVRRVAVNLDPREAALETIEAETAAEMLANQTGLAVRVLPAPDLSRPVTLGEAGAGAELWRAFLLAALLLLIAEMLIAARWKRSEVASA